VLLIVEDQLLVAMTLKDELEDHGYTVLELTTRHQEALAAARLTRPDLALVNIDLEDDDDGTALAWDLKAMGVPVLFISGQRDRVELAREAAIASLPKPYSPADMLAAVDYLFRHENGHPALQVPARLSVFRPMPTNGDARPVSPAV
jgi:DNA-binding response OmpR family regulator